MRPELISQPITGICSFGRYPICLDLDELKANFGVLGVPFDMGVGFLSGARMGPRRIREASTQYGRGAAVDLFQSIINIIVLTTANWGSRKLTEESLW